MRLLCPSGGCVPLDQYGACNVAKAAARAFVARPNWASNGVGASVVQAMNSAPSTAVTAGVNLINADYPVSADTKTLTQITGTFSNYFGASAVAAFERIRALQVSLVSAVVCCQSCFVSFFQRYSVLALPAHPDLGHTC